MPKQTKINAGGELFSRLLDYARKGNAEFLPKISDLCDFKTVFDDADTVNTCFCLFANDLNVSKTAAQLYMHRNTLIYKIARIKRLIGLDVASFSDAVTFMILYGCYKPEE